ncbi:MAG: hypothetical protein CSA62_08900 [Planctomycetota bacterium]|nr:MAG: hypothetical protein CSA62_08900 [Planctomycetota bacterium]
MSPIGRVFIVLNLVLSGVFLGYAGFYLKHADSWKTNYTKLEKSKDAEIATLTGENNNLTSDKTTLQERVSRLERTNSTLKNASAAKDDEIKDLNGRLTSLQSSFQGIQSNVSSIAQSSETQNERIAELSKSYLQAKNERAEAIAARDQAQEELEAERSKREGVESKNQALQEKIAAANEKIRDFEVQMETIVAAVPDLWKIINNGLPKVSGEVFAVNKRLRTVFLRLNKGAIAKVGKGWKFSIHDGKKYKGEVMIIDVDSAAKTATGRIVAEEATISRGDRAATQL